MAETALGMATTLVGSALRVASSAAREEVGLLMGVHDHIWFISSELKMMKAFLKAADGALENQAVLKSYLELIRDMAYDVEDCLEEFMVHVKHKSLLRQLLNLGARHRIAAQIQTIRQRVQEVSKMNSRYNLIKFTPSISYDVVGDMELTRNMSALYVEEAQLVGLDELRNKLMKLITKPKVELATNRTGPKVISVVGMGGLGKTTLAKKVYDSTECRDLFKKHAWVTVSQSFDMKQLLKEMMKELKVEHPKEHQGKGVGVQDLIAHLRKALKRMRYFVVLDDMWRTEDWDHIKLAFPNDGSEDSCVVVTTRDSELAHHCSPNPLIHDLKPLEKQDAEELLLKKTNKVINNLEKDNMKAIFEKILKKCGGLPLAIVTIGGLLGNKEEKKDWESLYDKLPSELASNPSLEALRQVVTLSYNHLPSHLKPCFLHLSIFPEDFEISRKHLVNRWIAEGYMTSGTTRRTLEDVSESYFYELVSRSMIQPSKLDILGNVKTCKVHDIVHDIAVSISRQENQVFLVEEHASVTSAAKETIRHISCIASKKLNIGLDLSRVRSFTVFNEPMEHLAILCSSKFKMLRVLDLKYACFTVKQQDINDIGLLSHLKFIHMPDPPVVYSLRRSSIGVNHMDNVVSYLKNQRSIGVYSLPRSIGNLLSLQTLYVGSSHISTLPTEITKLHSLRNLRCTKYPTYDYFDIGNSRQFLTDVKHLNRASAIGDLHMGFSSCWSRSSGLRAPKGIGMLKELQILEVVDIKRTSSNAIEELGELSQLRKLSVTGDGASKKNCETFRVALEKLCSLRSLHVRAEGLRAGRLDSLVSDSSSPPFLESLKLYGILQQLPAWVGKSTKLVKIELRHCKLKEIEALAELPNLIRLSLGQYSYSGEKLVFRGGAFPKLRIVIIDYSDELREVTFEASTSPKMESIIIRRVKLRSGISGIRQLPKLKEITFVLCQVAKLDKLKDEADKHPNKLVFNCLTSGDLQDTEESDVMVEAVESLSEPGDSS